MMNTFTKSDWYDKLLAEDKTLLYDCRRAQTRQGDMKPLELGYFDTQKTILLQDLDEHTFTCSSCPSLSAVTLARALEVQDLIARGKTDSFGILHKLQGIDLCLVAMQMCQAESRFGDFDAKKETPDELMLNDKTKVGFTTWDKLKEDACCHSWSLQPWFVSSRSELISPYVQNKLDETAMEVLVQLRVAQKA